MSFRVAFVPGVSPAKWARIWADRRAEPLEFVPVDDGDAAAAVLEDRADVCFARLPAEHERLSVIPLWTETPVVVAPKDHPIAVVDSVTLAELADETLLDGQDEGTLDLVAAGVGVAVMPQSVFRAASRRDLRGKPVTDAEETRIGLVWVTDRTTELVDEFIGIVRGRTANSSRGRREEPTPEPQPAPHPRAGGSGGQKGGGQKGGGQKGGAQKSASQKGGLRKGGPRGGQSGPKGGGRGRRGR
ncbi:LysR family transcriptional regulator substrate-binding protein [Herbiconiux sp. SYSU D00978]|uniref:LysR family transcriptional regulator substrate-binding protein n=1 Tax=Herbiconiux sp. SYSU D00978 TaxID=2812562 RepID=UPI0027DDD389|nr:LysR family transcriptional regulator substrate-binding protein [Herbiconiux sp. SYSU D00978]